MIVLNFWVCANQQIKQSTSLPISHSILDIITLVFNTIAVLPFNRDIVERLVVKERMKHLRPGTAWITRALFVEGESHRQHPGQRLTTSLLQPLSTEQGKQNTLRLADSCIDIIRHTTIGPHTNSEIGQMLHKFSVAPWFVCGVFSDRISKSKVLQFVDKKHMPKDGMTLVSSSKNTYQQGVRHQLFGRTFLRPFRVSLITSSIEKVNRNGESENL
ncbi:hypothetical protein CSKR_107147 [Clonorchis sinensis]|uniref:Uncharacterized protein n=1 Tax=Clonorchis sinensis TaxID=79923 RepID=A0A419QD30_CLOSI|nr:hypothetical protein CSKR_107147 [Clonorchis sinensis]